MTMLATASSDGTVKLWNVATGELILTLDGHTSLVTDLAISPDGSRLYSASNDGTSRTYLLNLDELIALAESRVTRSLRDDECREFLHLEACRAGR
jgi:WD40 repeat protein